jgi:chemotaxis protein MotA
MNISTVFSMIFTFVVVIISILISGDIMGFLDAPSAFIVIGGVICVTVASFSMDRLKSLMKAISIAFKKQDVDMTKDIETIVDIANDARRNGLLALEEMTEKMDEPFLKKGILLVVDGCDQELIRSIMETELAITKQRHADNRAVLESAGAYSPAFGMLGTLIGLVNMLANLDDMSSLGPNMSVALVTTVYGTMLANMIFNPLAKRLRTIGSVEYLRKELILEGIMAIQNGENPRVIREKLNAFLSNTQLKSAGTKKKATEEE